jgi:hypothetical protein
LLVSSCVGDSCGMVGCDKDRGRSQRFGTEDRGWSSTGRILGGQTIERSGDVVCSLHRAQGDEVHGFLRLASKPRSMVSLGLVSKPVATICQWFGLKTTGMGFFILTSKPTATVW